MAEDQRRNIIKTAGELFFRLGIRSVSIDDICREIGMSKKTFYVYFASKDELIEQMLQANINYMASKMQELLDLRDFRQLVKRFIKHQEAEKNDVRRVPQLVYDIQWHEGDKTGNVILRTAQAVLIPAEMEDFFIVPREKDSVLLEAYLQREEHDAYINPDVPAELEQ